MAEETRLWGWTDDDYVMLETLFHLDLSNEDIAQAMERGASTIQIALRRRGLKRAASNCIVCGAILVNATKGRRRRYCSDTCGAIYRGGNHDPAEALATARATPPRCTVCQEILDAETVRRRLAKKLTLDFCSGTCRQQAQVR